MAYDPDRHDHDGGDQDGGRQPVEDGGQREMGAGGTRLRRQGRRPAACDGEAGRSPRGPEGPRRRLTRRRTSVTTSAGTPVPRRYHSAVRNLAARSAPGGARRARTARTTSRTVPTASRAATTAASWAFDRLPQAGEVTLPCKPTATSSVNRTSRARRAEVTAVRPDRSAFFGHRANTLTQAPVLRPALRPFGDGRAPRPARHSIAARGQVSSGPWRDLTTRPR